MVQIAVFNASLWKISTVTFGNMLLSFRNGNFEFLLKFTTNKLTKFLSIVDLVFLYPVSDPEFPKMGVANLLFGQSFPEICMKMKEIGP